MPVSLLHDCDLRAFPIGAFVLFVRVRAVIFHLLGVKACLDIQLGVKMLEQNRENGRKLIVLWRYGA